MTGLSKTEIIWLQVLKPDTDEVLYIVTSDKLRSNYKLYEVNKGKAVFTKHKAKDPTMLDKFMKR